MRIIRNKSGSTTVEYALTTLVAVAVLGLISQLVGSNIFSNYLDRVISIFLVKVDSLGGLFSVAKSLSRY